MLPALAAILSAAVVAAVPTPAGAGTRATVAGTVTLTDARGEQFDAPGVELTLSCAQAPDDRETTASDEHGVFRFADVPPGKCSLTADLQGFANTTTSVSVRPGAQAQVKIHLELAPVDAGVQVLAKSTSSWHTKRCK